jgi:hypothetical protein
VRACGRVYVLCMYVCMYVCVCMCACVYVCIMYVCMYVCACLYVCMYLCMYAGIYLCIYVCMYVCMYVRMYVCVCMYVCMYVQAAAVYEPNSTRRPIVTLNTKAIYNPTYSNVCPQSPVTDTRAREAAITTNKSLQITKSFTKPYINILIHSLTPCSTVLLQKLTGFQLVKKFPAFYGTRRFITAFT